MKKQLIDHACTAMDEDAMVCVPFQILCQSEPKVAQVKKRVCETHAEKSWLASGHLRSS